VCVCAYLCLLYFFYFFFTIYLGVDPEIYELTTAKIENTTGRNIADAFTKLMESMEKTTTAR